MAYKASNKARAALSAGMNTTDTLLQISSGGSLFPEITGSDHTYVTVEKADGSARERMKVTAHASGSNSMTVVRGQDSTVAQTWLIGDIVELRPIAAVISDLQAEMATAVADHVAASDPHPTYTTAAELSAAIAAAASGYQPVDTQLTALSDLSAQQASDLLSLSAFMGTVLNDATQAAALATLGAPLNALSSKSVGYTVVATDRGKLIDYDSAGNYTLTLPAASTLEASALSVFAFAFRNSGTGTITVTADTVAPDLIDGVASIDFGPGESGFVVCDGTEWKTVGRTVSPANVKVSANDTTAGYLNGKLVAGSNITLTEGSDGGNETLTIAATGVSADLGGQVLGAIISGVIFDTYGFGTDWTVGTDYTAGSVPGASAGTWTCLNRSMAVDGSNEIRIGTFQRIA